MSSNVIKLGKKSTFIEILETSSTDDETHIVTKRTVIQLPQDTLDLLLRRKSRVRECSPPKSKKRNSEF